MVHKTGKVMTITFRAKNVDTEDVREAIEDNLGVEILSIDERNYHGSQTKESRI